MLLQSLFSSFGLVALSEMGDKTQLLAFALAARFKKPWPVMAGILAATVLNHALAASAGQWASSLLSARMLGWTLGLSFIAFGLWTLSPDSLGDEGDKHPRFGPFLTTTALFFLAEMGDKTQFATIALGARFQSALAVTFGTTAGMMLSDGLAVFAGERLAERISMKWMRRIAAGLFLIFGIGSLARVIVI